MIVLYHIGNIVNSFLTGEIIMYAYREYLLRGHCPYCDRDLALHIEELTAKIEYTCVDCLCKLTIIPNNRLYAEIFDAEKRRSIGDIAQTGGDCCGV